MDTAATIAGRSTPWNKGKLLGQKPPLRLKEIWAIRIRLQLDHGVRELALFNLTHRQQVAWGAIWWDFASTTWSRAVMSPPARSSCRRRRSGPVQFEITEQTREAVAAWVKETHRQPEQFLFSSRVSGSPHLSTRQYSRIVGQWVESIGLDPAAYGTHSLRRTKPTLIYRRTKNLRAVQLLLGHTKLESTVRYLGIEVDDALEIAEQTEV